MDLGGPGTGRHPCSAVHHIRIPMVSWQANSSVPASKGRAYDSKDSVADCRRFLDCAVGAGIAGLDPGSVCKVFGCSVSELLGVGNGTGCAIRLAWIALTYTAVGLRR